MSVKAMQLDEIQNKLIEKLKEKNRILKPKKLIKVGSINVKKLIFNLKKKKQSGETDSNV